MRLFIDRARLRAFITVAQLVCVVVSAAPPVAAQTGQVTGTVRDALGRPLAGARVRLESSDGKTAGATTADAQGAVRFATASPGSYVVVGERQGIETATAVR